MTNFCRRLTHVKNHQHWCAQRLRFFLWCGRIQNDWFIHRMREGMKRKLSEQKILAD